MARRTRSVEIFARREIRTFFSLRQIRLFTRISRSCSASRMIRSTLLSLLGSGYSYSIWAQYLGSERIERDAVDGIGLLVLDFRHHARVVRRVVLPDDHVLVVTEERSRISKAMLEAPEGGSSRVM